MKLETLNEGKFFGINVSEFELNSIRIHLVEKRISRITLFLKDWSLTSVN